MANKQRVWAVAFLGLLASTLVVLAAFALRAPGQPRRVEPEARSAMVSGPLVGPGHHVGAGATFEDLTVFPILAEEQTEVGPMTSLAAALADGAATVRELGADDGGEALGLAQAGGSRVDTLLIENRGDVPIYVLAGTVVKGGKQDRQIGQDFVVSARSKTPVDAFCVEQGRWDTERDGKDTGSKFSTLDQLATSEVRVAGHYGKSQGEVWQKVAKVNAESRKSKPSGTLLATLDDGEVKALRGRLAQRVSSHFSGLPERSKTVGLAWAVDGKVRGIRWFASSGLFELFRDTLVNTAAAEAVVSRGGARPNSPKPVLPEDVRRFVTEVDAAEGEERATRGGNVNEYKKAKAGYGSKTLVGAPSSKAKKVLSSDYAAK